MKKILVPCDFSTTAQYAYTFALDIAKKIDAELYVLNIADIPFMYEAYSREVPVWLKPEVWGELEKTAKESFYKLRDSHSRTADVTFRVIEGPVTLTILDFLEKNNIDLVVMGTSGASGIFEYLIGSNTEKIVRFSKAPVLAIRKAVNLSSIKNIVFPTDLSFNQDDLITKVKELQEMFGATLHLLSINSPWNMQRKKYEQTEMEAFAKHYNVANYSVNIRSDFSEDTGILSFTEEIKADMVAMATHSRRGLAHLFAGSVAEHVVNHISCPIWTCTLHK